MHGFIGPSSLYNPRLPIIINGAGPAGLILAVCLKNANIPFEIFENLEQDGQSKLRRNHVTHLNIGRLSILEKLLKFSTKKQMLRRISNRSIRHPSDSRKESFDHTEALMKLLRECMCIMVTR